MADTERAIEFVINYSGEDHRLQTSNNEYANLRDLIIDRLDHEDFGECGGVGRCATCMIQINPMNAKTKVIDASPATIYLACQLPVNDDLANVSVQILKNN